MRKHNQPKKRNQPAPLTPKEVVPPATPPIASGEPPPSRNILAIISLYVSILSLLVTITVGIIQYNVNRKQAEINQQNQDRATGKIQAEFQFVEEKPNPALVNSFMRKRDGKDIEVFRLDEADDIMRWGPSVTIKNVGSEIIDSIRVDVECKAIDSYGIGVTQIQPIPLFVNYTSSAEISNFGKFMPDQNAQLLIFPLLLDQMKQSSTDIFPGKDREGVFEIKCFCRIVGSSSYDAMEPRKSAHLRFHWKSSVFANKSRCDAIIKMQPRVKINS